MLFFADVTNFARPAFKTRRNHLNDIIFFFTKNGYYGLESKNTASQNIGAWDRMMTSYD